MRRIAAALTALSLAAGPALAAEPDPPTDPTAAPAPGILIAQAGIDALDADLKDEETLQFLQDKEYNASAQSMGAAIGLSLLPGAGWGLIYADKGAQSTVPFLLSAAGYAIGGLYMAGLFDESATPVCIHERFGRVGIDECGYGDIAFDPALEAEAEARGEERIDNTDIDPRDDQMPQRAYFATKSDYEPGTRGEDFDGFNTGLIIIGSTYVVTTLIGAVWAGSTVYDYNEQLRKDIEATAGRDGIVKADDVRGPAPAEAAPPTPYFVHSGQGSIFGVSLDF